jgi:hypothetical protein
VSPFTKDEWREILKELPEALDPVSVRDQVEAALAEYRAPEDKSAARRRWLWRRVAQISRSKQRELYEIVQIIGTPDPFWTGEFLQDPNWLPRLAADLSEARVKALAWAELYKPRERLFSRLFRVWTAAGMKLADSSSGPLVRFVQAVTDGVFSKPLTGDAVKKAAQRELERRRVLGAAQFRGEGNLTAHADVIHNQKHG